MKYIHRTIERIIPQVSANFKGILLSGMRQVGKSTLLKHLGNERKYLTLDLPELREAAMHSPNQLLEIYSPPVTIDEVQWAPELFPALKIYLDSHDDRGLIWLSGSQRLTLWAQIADKLPGRIVTLDLLPLSIYEREGKGLEQLPYVPNFGLPQKLVARSPQETWEIVFQGGWPAAQSLSGNNRRLFFNMLLDNYIAKDVVQLNSIEKRMAFWRFLQILAIRSGQELNYTALAQDCGLTLKNTREWLSIAEASGYIFVLPPYFENIGKRLVKSPKLYFSDTGLLCRLMNFQTPEEVAGHYNAGAIFETFVVMEIIKSWIHNGRKPDFYFYRDSEQNEIDLLIHYQGKYFPIEIKTTTAPKSSMLKGIRSFRKIKPDCGTAALISLAQETVPLDANTVSHSIWSI